MTKSKLERLVQSIGKRRFENCYEIADQKRENLTITDLVRHDPALKGTAEKGLATRLSCIKRIFREGKQREALAMAKDRPR